jgi:hypothetical protein
MGIEINPATLVKDEEKKVGINLGELEKVNPNWVAALGWEDTATAEVDGDLWLVGVDRANQAVDLVHYDRLDRTRHVTSGTGAYTYLGDARSGAQIKGDDEQGIIRLDTSHANGIFRTLVIGNIYEPNGLDWSMVPESYLRIFPEGVSDRSGKILIPEKANTIKTLSLEKVGRGARCVIFGWLEYVGPNVTDWKFVTEVPGVVPGLAPDIFAALAPFGVTR